MPDRCTDPSCLEHWPDTRLMAAPLLPGQKPEALEIALPTVATEGEEACRARSPHGGHSCQLPLWHTQLRHYERTGDEISTWLDDATINALQGPPDDRLWIGPAVD